MMKKILLSAATAAGLLASSSAFAQSVLPSIKLDVSLDVQDGCTLTGAQDGGERTTLNFGIVGNAAAVDSDILASTASTGGAVFTLSCNIPLTQVQLNIDGGNNSSGGVRRLVNEGDPTKFIPYTLHPTPARTTEFPIGTAVTILSNVASGVPQPITIYGKVTSAAAQSAVNGRHSDSAGIVVLF